MTSERNVLITGSNRGIGFEIARQLAKRNFHVIISGRDDDKLKTAMNKLEEEELKVEMLLMDVSKKESIHAAAEKFKTSGLKLDVLINNAAIGLRNDTSIVKNSEAILSETMETNGYGPLRVSKAFLPFIKAPGRIIMLSSGGGSMTDDVGGWWPAYCISKTFLNALTRHLAYELREKHISVNAVCPGWVRSEMGGSGASRSLEKGAETPAWLASDAAQHLTGKIFRDKKEIPW